MAAKRRNPSGPRWQVVFEEMRSQNRATLEHVEMIRVSLEQRIDRLDQDTRLRDGVLEMAIRDLTRKIDTLDHKVGTLDHKFDALVVPLETRVTAIEKRLG